MSTCVSSFFYDQNEPYDIMTTEIVQKSYGVVFAKEHMSAPFAICGGYLAFIYLFSNYMKNVQPFSLKKPLIYFILISNILGIL